MNSAIKEISRKFSMKKVISAVLFAALLFISCGGIHDIYNYTSLRYYSLSYDSNGGTGGTVPAESKYYPVNKKIYVSGNPGSLSKAGFTFNGWNTKPDGTGTVYNEGDQIIIFNTDIILYAKWISFSIPTYTVTYIDNGATGGTAPASTMSYTEGQSITVAGNTGSLYKTGFVFSGWNTAADGFGTTYSEGEHIIIQNSNITLYARWIAAETPTYTVTYNSNGATDGTVPVNNTRYTEGQPVTIAGNTGSLKKTDFYFTGWNDGAGKIYYPGDTLAIGTSNVILYANWNAAHTAVITPGSGSWLANTVNALNSEIKVIFDNSMNSETLSLAGTMPAESTFTWESTTLANDTLVIKPLSARTFGEGATLNISCTSMDGESFTLNPVYKIARSVCYVKSGATGGLTGTRSAPMNNLQTAVNTSQSAGTPGVVLVSEGTFSTAATLVTMKEGVSLYGGYSGINWDLRNPSLYITKLEDTRADASSSTEYNPLRIIDFPGGTGITAATVLDGFSLSIAPFDNSTTTIYAATAIYINTASPVIRNNTITSPNVSTGMYTRTSGIFIRETGTSPEICYNTIQLGSRAGTERNWNIGIFGYNKANPDIHHNTIHAGESTGTTGLCNTHGIYFIGACTGNIHDNFSINAGYGYYNSAAIALSSTNLNQAVTTIRNNSLITASATTSAWGIYISSYSHAIVEKNIIRDLSATTVKGIQVASDSQPKIYSNYIYAGNNPGKTNFGIQINNNISDFTLWTDIYNNIIDTGISGTNVGIEVYTPDTRIRIMNNTINGGSATSWANAISLRSSMSLNASTIISISNNNIFTGNTATTNRGIFENDSNSHPTEFSNNNIFNCSSALYYDFGGSPVLITDTATLNAIDLDGAGPGTITPTGNISENIYPYLNSADYYRFTESLSSFTFDTAGLDGTAQGWTFTTDREGKIRTAPWSIGAYEYD